MNERNRKTPSALEVSGTSPAGAGEEKRVSRRRFVQTAAAGLVVPAALSSGSARSHRAPAPLPRVFGHPFGGDTITVG